MVRTELNGRRWAQMMFFRGAVRRQVRLQGSILLTFCEVHAEYGACQFGKPECGDVYYLATQIQKKDLARLKKALAYYKSLIFTLSRAHQ